MIVVLYVCRYMIMYIYIYVYIYMCMDTCVWIHVCIYIYICMYVIATILGDALFILGSEMILVKKCVDIPVHHTFSFALVVEHIHVNAKINIHL